MGDTTHICEIEINGNIITRTSDGDIVQEFTGNLSILHKIYKFAIMDSMEKQRHKRIAPNLYIGTISYFIVHPGTKQKIAINSTNVKKLLQYITNSSDIQFGGLCTCEGADEDRF